MQQDKIIKSIMKNKKMYMYTKLSIVSIFTLAIFLSSVTFASAANYNASPGFPVTINGTNFTPEYNAVQFRNTATGAIYEALDIL